MNRFNHRMVQGYPASLEAICLMIREYKTETAAFRFALSYNGMTEEQAWDVYLAWSDKKLHPLAKAINMKVHGV